MLDLASPEVRFGPATVIGTPIILRVSGQPLLQIEGHEIEGSPFQLSGIFFDDDEQELFRIERNQWRGPISNWDITIEGAKITIRKAHRVVSLVLSIEPPRVIRIERINMRYRGASIVGTDNEMQVTGPSGTITLSGSPLIACCQCALEITESVFHGEPMDRTIFAGSIIGCRTGIVL